MNYLKDMAEYFAEHVWAQGVPCGALPEHPGQ